MGYKPANQRRIHPVQTKLNLAEFRAFNRALKRSGLSHAEFLRGLIEKHVASEKADQ